MEILLGLFYVSFLLPSLWVYGGFAPESEINMILNFDGKHRINVFDSEIISLGEQTVAYVLLHPINIFAKYYILDYGMIPRWSPAHKKVDFYFKNRRTKQ